MSPSNAAKNLSKNDESQAFDDLLGQLVDELAMAPSVPQPDPAPQVVRPAEPAAHGAMYEEQVAQPAVAPAQSRSSSTLAVVGIIAGAVVALGVAGLLILPGGDTEEPVADAAPVTETAPTPPPAPVAAPTPPTPTPVATPTPAPVEANPEDAKPEEAKPEEAASKPKPKPKKPPKKRPPKKNPPKKKPPTKKDSFEDM